MIILGIETSCDETASAVCKNGEIISSVVSQQIIHAEYGGVVPELASREHEVLLNKVVHQALNQANINLPELDGIAVTQGPGLNGTLLTGICFAKGLGLGLGIPVVPVNHLEGHIFANFIADPSLKFPFICLLVSGGHTQLWYVKTIENYKLLGETRDDAAGEAFDKGARILGLGYPGGPAIEKAAKGGDPNKIKFPRSLMGKDNLEFSFSGLKTSLLYFMDDFQDEDLKSKTDVIASYQKAIIDVLVEKVKRAMRVTKSNQCVIAGGVASNQSLRNTLQSTLKNKKIIFPDPKYCTDNGAMICFLGEKKLLFKKYDSLSFSALPNLKLS
tara:strand:- start:61 stop:1050 length:990 start_codon:yes stop_codon:yes gene_type:complete